MVQDCVGFAKITMKPLYTQLVGVRCYVEQSTYIDMKNWRISTLVNIAV